MKPLLRGAMAALAVGALGAATTACSSRQWYAAGQQWQASECRKLPTSEQARCLQGSELSYEAYQREASAADNGR